MLEGEELSLKVFCKHFWSRCLAFRHLVGQSALVMYLLIVCSFPKDLGQHPAVYVNIKLIKQSRKSRLMVPPPQTKMAGEQKMDEDKGETSSRTRGNAAAVWVGYLRASSKDTVTKA